MAHVEMVIELVVCRKPQLGGVEPPVVSDEQLMSHQPHTRWVSGQ